jgi:cobalt-zinc-cadmium resistance protein CzcA
MVCPSSASCFNTASIIISRSLKPQRISRNVKLPTGYRIEWAGEFEWLQQAKKRLAIILPITFVLIIILLYGLFNSFRDSLLALLGLPFAISGGILALYVSGLDFSISAAILFHCSACL